MFDLAESDPETLMLDAADVRRRITPRTKAIVAVHLWGNVCDLDALMAVSRETGVPLIEDCSHAHGATYKGRVPIAEGVEAFLFDKGGQGVLVMWDRGNAAAPKQFPWMQAMTHAPSSREPMLHC